jgi:hypothetical protein
LTEIFNNFRSKSGRGGEYVININDIEGYLAKMKSNCISIKVKRKILAVVSSKTSLEEYQRTEK